MSERNGTFYKVYFLYYFLPLESVPFNMSNG